MKKLILFAALLLVAAGSWAFYPKTAEPAGYMMLRSQLIGNGFSFKVLLSVYPADGPVQNQEIPVKLGTTDKALASVEMLRTTELRKLNEYRQAGWHLAQVMQSGTETIYILEK
ncbi:hypothetical protein EJV47_13890 [Hymenobacter gummosus]|uniref:DUF4907 domain-containing protein n=1 Tax=Hymenobacter gummosus TaxID=1776032 RepID=A0A3S0H4L6_9BACT|nr:hypothetical protein [Hymenobacter gummosus]RTQ49233.1 hypothetical protein EJV47_13890 [Hymenobacter gummosus]